MKRMRWNLHRLGAAAALAVLLCLVAQSASAAPGDVINCSEPYNISNSEGYVSIDPLLLSDPSGRVHLFWGERLIGQPDAIGGAPDSLMYAYWDGNRWSIPVDIFMSPPQNPNRRIAGIRGVIDDQGVIHLVWIGPDGLLFYGSSHVAEASSARGWQKPFVIVNDHNGIQYAAGVAFESPQTVHIAYGRAEAGASQTLEYIRSDDGGDTWSEPSALYLFPGLDRGASNVRVTVGAPGKVYVTWTEYDSSGNGQAVYFVRSHDGGVTWDWPVMLDERDADDYERDWTNLVQLDENTLMAFWEGGFRAYPQAQYSEDGGATWSEPIDTLYWLIADNGAAEFLRDSEGGLHLFIVRRIREGYPEKCDQFPGCVDDGNAIWHSVWEGETDWREPRPLLFSRDNYVAVATERGRFVHLAFFAYAGENPFEIGVMRCEISDVEALEPMPLPLQQPIAEVIEMPVPTAEPFATATPPTAPAFMDAEVATETTTNSGPGSMLLFSGLPVLGLVMVIFMVSALRHG